ncbi:MAG: DUF3592 domain-containing protein [Candidatus Zixiibacteriota bacterium]|nr:MAG: DUF3592 domain-containing protein [candidate division Zixibacteria bacterium]
MRTLLLGGLFLVVAVFGAVLAAIEIESVLQWRQIADWPSVEGTVIESGIAGDRAIHPHIVYEYMVDSVVYRAESSLRAPMFGGKRKKYDVAKELVSEYPVGRAIRVHYSPDSAAHSMILTEVPWDVYGKLSLGVTLCLIGMFGLIWPLRAIRTGSSGDRSGLIRA